ncbi:MAG: hypothetical protein ACKKMP_03605 [Candidatus Nealsonbacteria bacterium]
MSNYFDVSDIRSNAPEQLLHAAKTIGRSKHRLKIFRAIYYGKRKIKTAEELESILSDVSPSQRKVRVLQEGKKLTDNQIIEKVKVGNPPRTAYQKIPFYSTHYRKIIDFVMNPKKMDKVPTKRNTISKPGYVRIITSPRVKCQQITIDDINSFNLIKNVTIPQVMRGVSGRLLEKVIKKAFQKIIGESGKFKDWPGEQSDLFSTKLKIHGKRVATAIAFKGRATSGKLTPEKMGKRGDQVGRLFQEPAQLFLVVYQGQISSGLISQMQAFALGKAMSGQKIYYGVIDGDDLTKLIVAYEKFFK